MSNRANLSDVEEMLNKIIKFAVSACNDLPCITLNRNQYETYRQFNRPDHRGRYYFKNILLKRGAY